jgi:hypothetical protein
MPDPILEQVYELKSHPFPDVYQGPLDPRADPAQVAYYFDLYDWTRSPLLQRLSPSDPLHVFPDAAMLASPESILVLITGSNQTGRESLRNLILHKIEQATSGPNRPPIVTEIELEEGNRADIVRQIANMFMFAYQASLLTAPSFEVLQAALNNNAGSASGISDRSYYSGLFQIWKNLVRPHCRRPLVLSLSGIYLYNTLQVIFNSTHHLFKFIIVTTGSPSNAETCRKLLADDRKNVGLIEAGKLDRAKVDEYVSWRLSAERVAGSAQPGNSLVPFSAAALDELYMKGATSEPGETVRWHVEFLNKTLRGALDQHYAELQEKVNRSGVAVLNALAAHDRLIGAEHIRKARKAINKT